MREDDNPIDTRIDAALRSYAEPREIPDPRTVALRLLEQAQEAESRSRWPLWRWAIPACLVALAIAAFWMLRTPRTPEVAKAPAPPRVATQVKTPAPAPRYASVPAAPKRASRIVAAKSRPLPKLDVFPTPTPLSPQEQALVAFAKYGPPAVQRAVLQDQKDWNTPDTIAGLQPHPLPAANLQDQ